MSGGESRPMGRQMTMEEYNIFIYIALPPDVGSGEYFIGRGIFLA